MRSQNPGFVLHFPDVSFLEQSAELGGGGLVVELHWLGLPELHELEKTEEEDKVLPKAHRIDQISSNFD
jgi:hypothetical protein